MANKKVDEAQPASADSTNAPETVKVDADKPVFFITPIGPDASRQRRRANGICDGILKDPLDELGLSIQRADRIERLGMITAQIVEHIHDAPFVVADLTGHNPNVFYELGLADAFNKPVIRFVDDPDALPFDAAGERTIPLPDLDGNVEVNAALQARETFKRYAAGILKDGRASSVVASAQLRASFPGLQDSQDAGTTTDRMLRAILDEVSSLRKTGRAAEMEGSVATQHSLVEHLARKYSVGGVEPQIFPVPDGYAIDFHAPISVYNADELGETAFRSGLGRMTLISGLYEPPHIDLDEEPF